MTPPIQEPSEGLNAAVAAEVRAEQGRRKLSVAALAERTDIPYGSLRRYLNAERHIDVAVLAAVAAALDLQPYELVRRALNNLADDTDRVVQGSFEHRTAASSMEDADIAARDEDRRPPRID